MIRSIWLPVSVLNFSVLLLSIIVLSYSHLVVAIAPPASTKHYVSELEESYQKLLFNYRKFPNKTLKDLLASPPKSSADNSLKAQYYLVLSEAYYGLAYPDKAVLNAQLALDYIDQASQPWLFHKIQLTLAMALDIQGNLETAESRATNALIWARELNDERLEVSALFSRGVIRTSLVDYLGAMQDLQQAYRLAPKEYQTKYRRDLTKGDVANSLALLYEYRNEDDLAAPFYEESVQHCRNIGDELQLSISLYGLGKANVGLGNKKEGKAQLQEALKLSEKLDDIQGVAYALRALASIEIKDNNLEVAESLNLRAREIFLAANNAYMLLDSARHLSIIALKRQQLDLAFKHLKSAREHLNADSMPFQKLSLDILESQILSKTGEHEKAYQLLLRSEQAKAELLEKQSSQQLHRLRTQYELDVIEGENQLLEKANQLQQVTIQSSRKQNQFLTITIVSLGFVVLLVLVMVYRDRKHKAHLEKLASTDSLTELCNRRRTIELLEEQIALGRRLETALCVAILDLDHFKSINDKYGHGVGDEVLKHFAQLSRTNLRKTDIIGRIGGEEFLIVLPGTDLNGAKLVINKLRKLVNQPIASLNLDELVPSFSAGLGLFDHQYDLETFLQKVDNALYQAKQAGRNQIQIA
ncbi:GGDEF domain-containing protein [Aliikangiella marina]|uniref:diguanylate cyclase n=1 Tax=Aliikangiella marina TaxID=1712262 RepID=A0A545TBT2_9GAMM|nr:GGDEF domain-containing protein [Aliikangiella marina]TQV74664.1 GGDEF domain-containing protein [Aliikangiella marina]